MHKKVSLVLAIIIAFVMFIPAYAAETWTSNKTGSVNGYDYEFWKDVGNGTMTINGTTSNGAFSCEWSKTSGTNNFLARSGKKLGCTQTYSQYGNISLNYSVPTYSPSGTSYLAVYGWTRDPLVEWYIVENWNNYNPSSGASKVGSVTVDGGTYDILKTTRTNKPSIDGDKTFEQYWSVRTSKRTSGTVNVAEHFKAWEKAGFKMSGKLYEVSFVVEGYDGSGKANVQTMQLTMGGSSTTTTTAAATTAATTTKAATTTASSSGGDTKYTFSNLSFNTNTGVSSYSVNSSGALTVNYPGQYKEVKYNLPSNLSLANCNSIVVNGVSASGQTAVKFYDTSGAEAFVMYNNKCSSAADWTKTLSSTEKGKTIKTIGIMSQDTNSYSATINSITFKGVGSSSSTPATTTAATTAAATTTKAATTTAPASTSSSGTKYTFANLTFSSNVGVSSYSVSNGSLNVSYGGQYKEVKYNLPSNMSLANINSIVVNGVSANGQTAVKFYDTSGAEAFVMYNNKCASAADWTKTLSSTEKGKTIKTIGIMSQDTNSYSATINSITFK